MKKFIVAPEKELKHYGVKGMKWDKHLKGLEENLEEKRMNRAGVYSDRQIRTIAAGGSVPSLKPGFSSQIISEHVTGASDRYNDALAKKRNAENLKRASEEAKKTDAYKAKRSKTPLAKAKKQVQRGTTALKNLFR